MLTRLNLGLCRTRRPLKNRTSQFHKIIRGLLSGLYSRLRLEPFFKMVLKEYGVHRKPAASKNYTLYSGLIFETRQHQRSMRAVR